MGREQSSEQDIFMQILPETAATWCIDSDSPMFVFQRVGPSTTQDNHECAANFMFSCVGALSLHLGRFKLLKFLRHLGVEQVERRECEQPMCLCASVRDGETATETGPAQGYTNPCKFMGSTCLRGLSRSIFVWLDARTRV